MTATLARLAFPLLRKLDAERAHRLALRGLRAGLGGGSAAPSEIRLGVRALGLSLASPICLAAGFDKDGVGIPGLVRLGFGAIEAGTVTPLPQPGNPRPRLFRLPQDGAAINRMGFNNAGIERFATRLERVARNVPLGVNVGPNRDGANPLRDFPRLVAAVAHRADWVTINVSSPNTPGLRDWQAPDRLRAILAAITAAVPVRPPLLVKLSPDLDLATLGPLVEACVEGGAAGLIVANTTLARPPGLRGPHAAEAGGLSGRPLMGPSTAMLREVARLAGGRLTLVGAGGIATGEDVLAKLRAGARFVQLYTAFALHGPALLPALHRGVLAALDRQGFATVESAVGADL